MRLLSTISTLVFAALAGSSPPPYGYGHPTSSTISTPIASGSPSNTTCKRATPDLTNCLVDECPHKYTFEEFDPAHQKSGGIAAHSNEQAYFRFMVLFQINKALCEEQAHEHWKTVHADLTLASKDTGVDILRYTQFHADTAHREAVRSFVDKTGIAYAPYDGIAEFHAKDAASILRFMNHAFDDPTVVKDQGYFVNTNVTLHVMAGYDTLIYGAGVATSEGTDGVLPGDPRFL